MYLFGNNGRMAIDSIRSNKTRSLLTVVGIVIGVFAVVMIVSLSEGMRHQVIRESYSTEPNLITVQSGKGNTGSLYSEVISQGSGGAISINTLTEQDYRTIQDVDGDNKVVPISFISGQPKNYSEQAYEDSIIIGTSEDFPSIINNTISYGSFFSDNTQKNTVVVGKRVAEGLYGENVPIGKLISIRDHDFIISGVFDEFKADPTNALLDFNKAIFMSYDAAKTITNTTPFMYRILVIPGRDKTTVINSIRKQVLSNHDNKEDFSVLSIEDVESNMSATTLTKSPFMAMIALVSLVVGGIGVMNIMFVAVTERTKEIGIRKSIGATNSQIYNQFLMESIVLSLVGGVLGVVLSLFADYMLRVTTALEPIISWQIIILSVGVSVIIGIIFGTGPAIKAASKDPIESLRYE